METAAQVIDTTSKRKGLVNAATIAHMIAMPKKIHAIFPAIYILPFHEKQLDVYKRQELIAYSPAMIGTVPMYDAIGYLEKDLMDIKAKDFLKVVQAHAEEGVDFMTIHAGINKRAVECFKRTKRMTNIVSREMCIRDRCYPLPASFAAHSCE